MSIISRTAARNFLQGYNSFTRGNTQVRASYAHPHGRTLRLHGNVIAYRGLQPEAPVFMTMCGWATATSRNRLNAVLNEFGGAVKYQIKQRDGNQWLFAQGPNDARPYWITRLDPGAWYSFDPGLLSPSQAANLEVNSVQATFLGVQQNPFASARVLTIDPVAPLRRPHKHLERCKPIPLP